MREIIVSTNEDRIKRQQELNEQKFTEEKQLEKDKKKRTLFIQIPLNYAVITRDLNPFTLKLFTELCCIAFDEKYTNMTEEAYCVVSLEFLKSTTKMSKTSIIKYTQQLIKKDFIKVFKSGNTNVYAINPSRAWRSSENRKWRALYNKDTNELSGYKVRGNIVIDVKSEK